MKPSEKRALKAEKLAQAEKEAFEGNDSAHKMTENFSDVKATEEHGENTDNVSYKRREGFFQSHVRLITFLITGTLVFVAFCFGIDGYVKKLNDNIVHSVQDIDMQSVFSVYDNAEVIEWKNFKNFNYEDHGYETENGKYYVREYPISDSRLVLKVGGPAIRNRPEYVQLIDYRTGQYINVFNEDPRDFIRTLDLEEKET